jgi:hypothetical protein
MVDGNRSLSSSFESIADECVALNKTLERLLGKVMKVLKEYARLERGKALEKLTVLDVCDSSGRLHPDLSSHIARFYPLKSTRQSQKSNIKRIVTLVLESLLVRSDKESLAIREEDIPEYMRPLWYRLPRKGWRKLPRNLTPPQRAALPLTRNGEVLLKVFLAVNDKCRPTSLQGLLVDCHEDLYQEVITTVLHRDRELVVGCLGVFRKAFNLKLKGPRPSVKVDQLPPRMRAQLDQYLKWAPIGLGAVPEFAGAIAHFRSQLKLGQKQGRSLDPHKKVTIRGYKNNFLLGLAYMDLEDGMGVEDLMKIVPTVRVVNGREVPDIHNPKIDQYRMPKAEAVTRFKTIGFDTCAFSNFLSALEAIAVFNGYFELIEPFKKAYRSRIDRKTRRTRRAKKRSVMTRLWLHENILLLTRRFKRIIRSGSFKTSQDDLDLCFFLVQLVVLRYMGFRQQCLRNCRRGVHIKIVPGTSVAFKWAADEIKNEVDIDTTISMEEHGFIPELVLMLNVLSKYYTRVLPVLPELYKQHYGADFKVRYDEQVGEEFFCRVGADGVVSRFGADSEDVSSEQACFTSYFQRASYRFMDFSSLQTKDVSFHPHFLRGVCCDWMRYDLKMSWSQIAQVLGDTEETVRREYFQELSTKSATGPFASVSKAREEEHRRAIEVIESKAVSKQKDKTLAVLDSQVLFMTDQYQYFKDLSEKRAELLKSAESENSLKDQRIAALAAEVGLLRSLLPVHTGQQVTTV